MIADELRRQAERAHRGLAQGPGHVAKLGSGAKRQTLH